MEVSVYGELSKYLPGQMIFCSCFTIVDNGVWLCYGKIIHATFTGGAMQISLTFKNVDSSEYLKSHTQEKFGKLDRMLDNPADAHIVLSAEKLSNIAEINLNCGKIKIHAKEESEKNMYSAIDVLSDKVRLQIKKHTEKLKRHLSGDKFSIKTDFIDFISSDNLVEDSIDG